MLPITRTNLIYLNSTSHSGLESTKFIQLMGLYHPISDRNGLRWTLLCFPILWFCRRSKNRALQTDNLAQQPELTYPISNSLSGSLTSGGLLLAFQLRIDLQEDIFFILVVLFEAEEVVEALLRLLGQLQSVNALFVGADVVLEVKVEEEKAGKESCQ